MLLFKAVSKDLKMDCFIHVQCAGYSAKSYVPDQPVSRVPAASKDDSTDCKWCTQITPSITDLKRLFTLAVEKKNKKKKKMKIA